MKKIILLLIILSSYCYSTTIHFEDFTGESKLKVYSNNTVYILGNNNQSELQNDSKVFELNGIQNVNPTGILFNNFNVILLIVIALFLGLMYLRKRK